MIKIERKTASEIMLTLLIGSMLFSAISLVKAQTDKHDLRVTLEAGPSLGGHHLTLRQSRVLNATVWNDGNVTEPTVTLQLLINGSEAVHSTVANLSSGAPFKISYTWVPSESNVYNITAYAPPITSPEPETNTTNNVAPWLVNVCNDTPPTVDFTYSPQLPLAGQNVTFDASNSSDPDWGNITNYVWNFNGTTVPKNEPSTNYPFPGYGNANVTLTLYDTEGENSSLSKPLRVCEKPKASFNIFGLLYKGYQLTFDATGSRDPDNDTGSTRGIANYAWDFNDTSSLYVTPNATANHNYTTTGIYSVNLTVTDYDGFNDYYVRSISVKSDIPTADFKITNPVAGPYYVSENLTFMSTSTKDGADISSYLWDWNDTTPPDTTGPVTYHNFTQPNTYNVTLTVTDANNKTSPLTVKSIVVIPRVLLEVTNSTGGTTLTANPGETFNVSIIVINVEALYTFNFTLKYPGGYPSPLLKFNALFDIDFQLGPSTNDQLEGTITVNGTKPIGGTTGNLTLAIITFAVTNPGMCSLPLIGWTLLNTTGANISASAIAAVFFSTRPVANFTCPQYAVANMTDVLFDASESYDPDNMTAPNRGIATYTWNFDDGNTTTVTSPTITHPFESVGRCNVNLTVTDYASETWLMNYTVIVVTGRDVAVVKIELGTLHFNSTTGLYETAGKLPMNVTVTNEGNSVSETFNVTIKFGNTSIETEPVIDLMPGENRTVRFSCDIDGISKGIYNISAYAWPVVGETNTADNTLTDGLVSVFTPGDVDRNGIVNVLDAIDLSNSFGKSTGQTGFIPNADFDDNGIINILDAITLANNFGKQDS
jgi:PKD repeat protein